MARAAAISDADLGVMIGRFNGGAGEAVPKLAADFGLTATAVRYHLKKNGVYPMTSQAGDTDEDLGIGQDDAPSGLSLDAILAHPELAAMIDKAVAARTAQMGASAPLEGQSGMTPAFAAFLDKLEHVIEVTNEQRPGYIKQLTVEEMDARASGKIEMHALVSHFKAEGIKLHYLLGDVFYGPSPAGPVLYEAGQTISCYLPPAENWQPLNEPAAQVYSAYKRWVGEVAPIEDLLAQALMDARGGPRVAEVTDAQPHMSVSDVEMIDAPRRDVSPKRTLGTTVPENRGKAMPGQPGATAQPLGPFEVG